MSNCENQISKTKCIEICNSNNPAISGGYNAPPLGVESTNRAAPGIYTRDIGCCRIHRSWKYAEIFFLILLIMATVFTIPRNVQGEEIYRYTDKNGAFVITNIPPSEEDILSDSVKSKSKNDLTSEERLHMGRDNALMNKSNKGDNKQRKKDGSIDAGIYEVKIRKIGSNLYQDIPTRMIIRTSACKEPAGGDESQLDWYGSIGELYFKKTSKSCMVKKVFQN